jgi:DNA-binding CsgD family transcriptional regulator
MIFSPVQQTYFELLGKQHFEKESLDYSRFESQKIILDKISTVGNSSISVFDLAAKEHIFHSSNFLAFLGYHIAEFHNNPQGFLDGKIHPDDLDALMLNGISLLKLFYEFSPDEKYNYKLLNEFRVKNKHGDFIKVIEQHQTLELDESGNLWLALSIIDISPSQDQEGIKSSLINIRTGKIITFIDKDHSKRSAPTPLLSKREGQILKMVKEGFLSKEISDKLGISLHTVNTHRQRVLEKLQANNSMEAIVFASKLGLI